jgi:putative endonuclease
MKPRNDRAWRSAKGLHYESLALAWLRARGLRLVQRNYRCPLGEIDLIMRDGAVLVFVEVRFRAASSHGAACETVDSRKQQKLLRSAQHFLLHNAQLQACPCRFDILGISSQQRQQVHWLRDAFH